MNISISKTKVYILFGDLERAIKSNPKDTQKEMDALEDEIMRLITAHSIFVWGVKNCADKIEELGISDYQSITSIKQMSEINIIISRIKTLNDYYYKKMDE